ncbi:acyl-CoA dehydrogenase [Robbsia andropogonis]|uniref:Acyl-CoA dehydrogenase n=1 Tax=Robbsia andropogonis TaxID=28092 RepID=A0A0F5K4T6_9BURK|nr:acyl-CoA dehydrogenase [Robbsia andropogonis]KKB64965.1 acyl-CoA dehydrogenase [Robbsia andropogonis]MCP1118503.1 acyl-CoA dehydrogenase [Robbsia andropogonis]MCP1127970.1 acyl-CoA dehydrogenase [Robbsia andropogonis]
MSTYKVSLRELRFFLWELFEVDRRFLGQGPYSAHDREHFDALLERARDFALDLGNSYQMSDIEGCHLLEDGQVQIPSHFHALWARFRDEWSNTLFGTEHGLPPIVTQVIYEMFMGANPSFMTYGGFTRPAIKLLKMHGTSRQKSFMPALESYRWDACFCATEPQAGTDLTAVALRAEPLEQDVYAISGEKVYISAGMHELTENTLYFVLGRIDTAAPDSFALSCLVVPRYWPDERTGELTSNHITCAGLPRKMGLKGCANTHLIFGSSGTTRGWLLGSRRNVGLLQLMPLMNQARMSTGMFGVGVASSAYLHAVDYASHRLQGRPIERASNTNAARVAIIEHADVQRMLLDMKSRVDGCRGLLGKLAATATRAAILETTPGADPSEIEKHRKLQLLLTPICKAFISDQAWRICETAIQVHGGLGYTDASPVEQNARDVKILSIWEGTNYIQAQDLVRDKLGFGRNSRLIRYYRDELDVFLATCSQSDTDADLRPLFEQLRAGADQIEVALAHIAQEVQDGHTHRSSQFYTRFLDMFGLVTSAWVLLESACIASRRLAVLDAEAESAEASFYRGKYKSARYFFANVLPLVDQHARAIASIGEAAIGVSSDELVQVE